MSRNDVDSSDRTYLGVVFAFCMSFQKFIIDDVRVEWWRHLLFHIDYFQELRNLFSMLPACLLVKISTIRRLKPGFKLNSKFRYTSVWNLTLACYSITCMVFFFSVSSRLVSSLAYLGLSLYGLLCDFLTGPLTFDNKSLYSLEVGSSLCTNFKCGGILFTRDIHPGAGQ